MTKEKYAEVMRLRAAYAKGVRDIETRAAQATYCNWQYQGVAEDYRLKYGKWSDKRKVDEIEKILKGPGPLEERFKKVKEVLVR